MGAVQDQLRAAGIGLAAGDDRPALRSECARLARRARERQVRTLGLAPAGDDVAVPAVAVELGRALADSGAGPVGVVDVAGSWACARTLVEDAAADGGLLATTWLGDNLALLMPRASDPGAVLGQLGGVVLGKAVFDRLVVDLTGLEQLGEQLAAFQALDAVVIVARSGRTTARQIRRCMHGLPEGLGLGVLLTGV